jgi:DNA-damage-inducible protein D
MASELEALPQYQTTMERLERSKRTTSSGIEFWMARDVQAILSYSAWRDFEGVIDRARSSLLHGKADPSQHIVPTHKMVDIGSGAQRQSADFFLSRAACYLVAMNGDPSMPEIAAAQAYFAVQTRRMELVAQVIEDQKRLDLREKVSQSHKRVSRAAQDAGLSSKMQGVFHDARYQGLYGMSLRSVKIKKGLGEKEQLYDRAGPLELSANDFQMNLATDAIRNEGIRGEQQLVTKNKAVAADVRRVMREQGATMPENLPLAEPIAVVKKRLKTQKKKLASPTEPSNE